MLLPQLSTSHLNPKYSPEEDAEVERHFKSPQATVPPKAPMTWELYLVPKRAQPMGKQAGGCELTLLEDICQEEGETGAEAGKRGEKGINNNVDNDRDDKHS